MTASTPSSSAKQQKTRFWPEFFCYSLATVALYLSRIGIAPIAHSADRFLSGRRSDLYGAILGLEGTLLGFSLASLTIALSYVNSPRFTILSERGQWRAVLAAFIRATRWTAISALVSLVALLFDRDSDKNALISTGLLVSVIMSAVLMGRMLWVIEGIVHILVTKVRRKPGE